MNHQQKYLLFSSVGDQSQFYDIWCCDSNIYDVYIHYYGDKPNENIEWKNKIDFLYRGKGWKFNVLTCLHKNNQINLQKYKYVAVFDDDLIIGANDINRLFIQTEKHDLYFSSPAFCKTKSKISHKITAAEDNSYMRYVNFIEVTAPVIRSDILINILNNYNGELIGFGFDYYMLKNYYYLDDRIAIFDNIICVNPFESDKKVDQREITKYYDDEYRKSLFSQIIKENNAMPPKKYVYKKINNNIFFYLRDYSCFTLFALFVVFVLAFVLIFHYIVRVFVSFLNPDIHS